MVPGSTSNSLLEGENRASPLLHEPSPIERFVRARRARWERLGALLKGTTGGRAARAGLTLDELNELVELYRAVTADLAIARRDFPGDRVTLVLNQLAGRGYAVIYREPPAAMSKVRRYFARDLPRAYRAAWPYLVASALLFFVPFFVTLGVIVVAPDTASLILPPGVLSGIKSGQTWFAIEGSERSAAASFIMTNNIKVTLMALGGGMLAGVGTVVVLIVNGVEIGAVAGALLAYGLWRDLLGFVTPHGFLELSVIVVSGGCGLMIGRAIVWPGLAPRGEALVAAARASVCLLLGMLPFLVIAGLLEGFVSPVAFAWQAKLAIGVTTGVGLYAYLLGSARGR